jgi:hypothetical protein
VAGSGTAPAACVPSRTRLMLAVPVPKNDGAA